MEGGRQAGPLGADGRAAGQVVSTPKEMVAALSGGNTRFGVVCMTRQEWSGP